MTTAELIAHLQTLPPDSLVVVDGYEEGYTALRVEEIRLIDIERKEAEYSFSYFGEYTDAWHEHCEHALLLGRG